MTNRSSQPLAIVAGLAGLLCAAAGIAQGDAEQRAPQLRIYTFGELNVSRYEVVGRPWVDSWRSAFWVPTFPSEEQAIAALRTEAARRGAEALLNVYCLDQARGQGSSNTEPAFLCYGIAIRILPSQG